jgi:hypothetical protein
MAALLGDRADLGVRRRDRMLGGPLCGGAQDSGAAGHRNRERRVHGVRGPIAASGRSSGTSVARFPLRTSVRTGTGTRIAPSYVLATSRM